MYRCNAKCEQSSCLLGHDPLQAPHVACRQLHWNLLLKLHLLLLLLAVVQLQVSLLPQLALLLAVYCCLPYAALPLAEAAVLCLCCPPPQHAHPQLHALLLLSPRWAMQTRWTTHADPAKGGVPAPPLAPEPLRRP